MQRVVATTTTTTTTVVLLRNRGAQYRTASRFCLAVVAPGEIARGFRDRSRDDGPRLPLPLPLAPALLPRVGSL
jgi:hypothetical protein